MKKKNTIVKKKEKPIDFDAFNRFALEYTYFWETFFYMDGIQVTMNPRFTGTSEMVLEAYRKQLDNN